MKRTEPAARGRNKVAVPAPIPFSWDKYLEECSGYACREPLLFEHVTYMEQTVMERLCPSGTLLFVNTRENGVKLSRIETTVVNQLYVEYLDYGDRDWVSPDDVITDEQVIEKQKSSSSNERYRNANFLNVEEFVKYFDRLTVPLQDLVQPGQYFELQDYVEPDTVVVARITQTAGSIVIYECIGNCGKVLVTNITDPLCHAMGWTDTTEETVKYRSDLTEEQLVVAEANPVPDIVFDRIIIRDHALRLGMQLEVQDMSDGTVFFPGHVSETINEKFFKIKSSSLLNKEPEDVTAHIGTPGIYHHGHSAVRGQTLLPPRTLFGKDTNTSTQWSWADYVKSNGLTQDFTSEANFFIDSQRLSLPRVKLPIMQFVEIFCYNQGLMMAAQIVRWYHDTVWYLPGYEKDPNRSLPFHIGCMNIFPCGYADKHNLPLISLTACTPYFKPVDEEGLPDGSDRRTLMARNYRSVPGAVFKRTVYSGRGRPEKRWPFMPEYWMDDDKWLPSISIRRGCRVGDFFDKTAVEALPDHYDAGPLPHVTKQIVKDLFRCALFVNRTEVTNVLHTELDLPVVVVKHRWRAEHNLLKVPACESAAQFNGWIKNVLRALGCCQNLLTMSPEEKCDLECGKFTNSRFHYGANENANGPGSLQAQSDNTPPGVRRNIRTAVANGAGADESGLKKKRRLKGVSKEKDGKTNQEQILRPHRHHSEGARLSKAAIERDSDRRSERATRDIQKNSNTQLSEKPSRGLRPSTSSASLVKKPEAVLVTMNSSDSESNYSDSDAVTKRKHDGQLTAKQSRENDYSELRKCLEAGPADPPGSSVPSSSGRSSAAPSPAPRNTSSRPYSPPRKRRSVNIVPLTKEPTKNLARDPRDWSQAQLMGYLLNNNPELNDYLPAVCTAKEVIVKRLMELDECHLASEIGLRLGEAPPVVAAIMKLRANYKKILAEPHEDE